MADKQKAESGEGRFRLQFEVALNAKSLSMQRMRKAGTSRSTRHFPPEGLQRMNGKRRISRISEFVAGKLAGEFLRVAIRFLSLGFCRDRQGYRSSG